MGKECWVGKEGRHAGLCVKSKRESDGEIEREKVVMSSLGEEPVSGQEPKSSVQHRPGSCLKGEVGESS